MLAVKCPFCGQPVDLSQMNVMGVYERYLILTFVLSLLMRFKQYRTNISFAWQFPQRWPSVLEVVKAHKGIFLTWTTLLPVGVTLAVLLAHSLCYRLIWQAADVTPTTLGNEWYLLPFLVLVCLTMLALDLQALFSTTQTDFDEIETALSRGEYVLSSRAMVALRVGSFGLFSPKKYIENRIEESLQAVRLVLLTQLRRWSFHTAVRIAFGFLLWWAYALVNGFISIPTYWINAAFILAGLGVAYWWAKQPVDIGEIQPDSETE